MFNVQAHKPNTHYSHALRADITVDEMTPGSVDAAPEAGRTVHLQGRVSTNNIYQMLQLLAVGDAVMTDHPTTAANLISIAFCGEFCHHLDVHAFAGELRIQRVS